MMGRKRMDDTLQQRQMLLDAGRRTAIRDETFLDIMGGPQPMTQVELKKLVMKDPKRYGRYIPWIAL